MIISQIGQIQFNVCLKKRKEVSYSQKGCIYLIKNTIKKVILLNKITVFYFNIFENVIYSYDRDEFAHFLWFFDE